MALKTSKVYRCLEKKTLVLGFEIVDLFLVFSLLATLNFFLGSVSYKFFLTWGPAIALGLGLRILKRGKPDNYLGHYLQFQFSPGAFSCFSLAPKRKKGATHVGIARGKT